MKESPLNLTFSPEILEKAHEAVVEGRLMDLKSDVGFKRFFGSNNYESRYCLKKFLSAITNQTVTEVNVINGELLTEMLTGKQPRLDINCIFDNGQKADLEMQVVRDKDDLSKRAAFYATKLYASTMKRGESYSEIPSVYQVFIVDFDIYEDDDYFRSYYLYDSVHNSILTDSLRINFIELTKMNRLLEDRNFENLNDLEFWSMLLKNTRKVLESETTHLEEIKMAETLINSISQDEIDWAIQMSIEGGELDYYAGLRSAKREGIKEGIKEGLREGHKKGLQDGIMKGQLNAKIDIAKTLLSMGNSVSAVSEITKLSIKEIESLRM